MLLNVWGSLGAEMKNLFERLVRSSAMALAALCLFATPPAAIAQDSIGPTVAVPAPSSGGGLTGCFRIQETLYKNYRMSFCLNGRGNGTYNVSGGVTCQGNLDWYDLRSGKLAIDLARATCGRGQAWTGDSLDCKVDKWKPETSVKIGGVKLTVPIPGGKTRYDGLKCTYNPVGYGYKPVKVTAKRV
jgi:hypothetical protein